MNQDNTIKSLIPETILEGIPSKKRVHFASRIVEFFKDANPDLYETIGGLDSLPDELKDERFWHAQHSPSEEKLYQRMIQCWGERFRK